MLEALVIGLAAVVVVMGFLLYRQRRIITQAAQSQAGNKQELETLRQDVSQQRTTIENLHQEITKLDALILRLRQTMAETDSASTGLEKRIAEQEATIASLRAQIRSTEQESRQSKALFSTISNVAYDMVFVLDEDGIIVALNKAADEFLGEAALNPLGERITEVINAPDLEDILARAVTENESLEEQFKIENRYYRARTQVMRYDESAFIGVAVQDITQLVRLNRARRDMVANISHELRTPIQNIRLIIDGLFHDQTRPKRKASIASLRAIAHETETLQWTVQELLDLSMIESGQAIMKLVEEPLSEIVDEAVARLQDQLDKKNLSVVRHIPAKMRVLCDREHIRRVFINLINNAIKWSPDDEAITISAHNGGEEVTIRVFDNGPGVPEDQRERIFERFYQVDTARSGEGGSGLGLAICKHVIEAHGGSIWAEGNAQGSGGRFLFTLLNATSDVSSEDVYMDRGQHDFIWQNPPPQIQIESAGNGLPDDYEIELLDDEEDAQGD